KGNRILCLKESSTVTLSLGSRTIFSSLERARPNRVELAAIDPLQPFAQAPIKRRVAKHSSRSIRQVTGTSSASGVKT
ncbi:MAG: hypothetical protein KA150_12520, partial [Propionivibrio sp.]|nr:hypothetical protein [Propionivibrio sp.]